jgi:hypothetical protein
MLAGCKALIPGQEHKGSLMPIPYFSTFRTISASFVWPKDRFQGNIFGHFWLARPPPPPKFNMARYNLEPTSLFACAFAKFDGVHDNQGGFG